MVAPTLLLISTDSSLIEAVREVTRALDHLQLTVLPGLAEAAASLSRDAPALLLLHLVREKETPGIVDLMQKIAAGRRPTATLVVSDQYRAEQALTLLRKGAADCLARPLDLTRFAYLLDTLTARSRYEARSHAARSDPVAIPNGAEATTFFYIPSAEMGRLMEQIQRVAPQSTTLLLGGETGTGKTRLARLIHELSPRKNEPFRVVNCGALSASLIESEMFGHVKGAFTGADRDHIGKFAEVGRGTLLLDEIDSLPLPLQAKLLRVVEERIFEPVGSNKSLPVEARLIAASNRLLDQEVAGGRFRSDLYYRLNVVAFYLPPLRDRRSVIQPLAEQFRAEFAARNCRDVRDMTPEALLALEQYDWPGNIRELRNALERAVALCVGTIIQLDDLPNAIRACCPNIGSMPAPTAGEAAGAIAASTLAQTKEEAEVLRIRKALRDHGNNRLHAAAELGISRMALYRKLHRYGLMQTTQA